jgi:hypothetical protein
MSNATLNNAVRTEAGVSVNGLLAQPIIEKCEGCERVRTFEDEKFCSSYPVPERKWNGGNCNFATHIATNASKQAKVNPLKASKRAAKKR